MRWLLPGLLAAQALGIALADRALLGSRAALALAALCALGCAGGRAARSAGALGLAAAAGALSLALRLEDARPTASAVEGEHTFEACIARRQGGPEAASLVLDGVTGVGSPAPGLPRRLLLRVAEPTPFPLDVGICLRARARIGPPRPLRNPGGSGSPRRLERQGIGALAWLVDPAWIARLPARERPGVVGLHTLRRRLGERLERLGPGGALLRALALGDRSGLASERRDDFARLGIAHLLAVSGLHLGLLVGAVFALARRLLARSAWLAARRDTRDPARALAALAGLGYALLAGFGVPVRRALVLVAALAFAAWRGRRGPPLQPLALAGLAVLALDPAALFDAGAQLSFAACAALLLVLGTPRARGGRERVARAVRASAVATAVTAPLAALQLGAAAPLAVPVNLIAIPWTAGLLLPAALVASALVVLPASPPLDALLAASERIAAATLAAGAWLAPLVPGRLGVAPHPVGCALAVACAVGTLATRRTLPALALAALAAVVLWLSPPPPLDPPPPRLVVLDVGAGDAILVQGRRASLLVDAGAAVPGRFDRGAQVVVPALRALGVARLDLVVASHADLDHRGGLPAVLRSLPVGALWIPARSRDEPGFAPLREAARSAGVELSERARGAPPVRIGDLRVEVLWPPPTGDPGVARNERSLGLRIALAGRRVLLLGDLGAAEGELLRAGPPPRAEVLVLPHHGSRHSSRPELLAAVAPQIAIVSGPCPPRRSLPHPETLARARRAGASLWWTGRDGALVVGLADPLLVAPSGEARVCAASPQATFSVPTKASTSGRQTKRTGGSTTRPLPIEAETGW